MSEVHFEAPTDVDRDAHILGWMPEHEQWSDFSAGFIARYWSRDFTAWMEMPPAPVKPKRFVVIKTGVDVWAVVDDKLKVAVADSIGSKEAAQRIADIYEETTP